MKYFVDGTTVLQALQDAWSRGLMYDQVQAEILADFGVEISVVDWAWYCKAQDALWTLAQMGLTYP